MRLGSAATHALTHAAPRTRTRTHLQHLPYAHARTPSPADKKLKQLNLNKVKPPSAAVGSKGTAAATGHRQGRGGSGSG